MKALNDKQIRKVQALADWVSNQAGVLWCVSADEEGKRDARRFYEVSRLLRRLVKRELEGRK